MWTPKRKTDIYHAEREWLRHHGIENPSVDKLKHIHERDKRILALWCVIVILIAFVTLKLIL
jgi:hypothetical protein